MNPIATWSEVIGYGNWCYQYRIPIKEEFIDGFKYEFRTLTTSIGGNIYGTEKVNAYWTEYVSGNNKDHKYVEKFLHQYLEAGYIRVKKADERLVINKYDLKMKLFYYKVEDGRWILERDKETNKITKYTHDLAIKNIIKYIVVEASIVKEGEEFIHDTLRISNVPNEKQEHSLIQLNGEEAYTIGIGKELFLHLDAQPYEVIILGDANKRIEEILPSIPKVVKIKKSFIKLFGKTFKERVKKIMESVKITIVKVLPNDRYLGHNKGWKPLIVKPTIQPEKSPDRLVCIATKDRGQHKRITWKDANELIITQLADDPQWEYISKEEYKKLNRPTPGLSFIPVSESWIEPETEEFVEEYVGTFKNIYKPTPKFSKGVNSTKRKDRSNISRHKRSHPGRTNKIITLNTYEISIEKHDPKSVGPEVKGLDYTITSSSELKAKNRVFKMSKLDINLKPYYNVIVKRSIPIDTNTQLKKNNVSKALFEAKEWVSEFSINKIDKLEGEKIIPSTIKIFKRKYEDLRNPFKKTKKWKCPKKNEKK